ncbi:MAG: hypothetical protein GXP37_12385 [Chloroflexi bacterium]|nr:hypothetical protein [Chloroflexota bacterium]
MTTFLSDTSPEAEAVLYEMLRQASPARKLEMVGELNTTVRQFALAGLRQRYPRADKTELRRRLADLLLGPELARRAYGSLPEETKNDE